MSGLTQTMMRAPFPWYGGKRRVAEQVWQYLGRPGRYVEPFAGSLGVLLGRPGGAPDSGLEVVNDLDGYIVNVWRSIKHAPRETAEHAIDLVSEIDTTARHVWLVNEGRQKLRKLSADPEWCDPKIAGWWLYGIAAWIGGGWCSGKGPWTKHALLNGDYRQLPHLGDDGRGVNRQLPHLGNDGQGVNRKLPHLGDDGQGVNRKLPHLGNDGQGVNRQLPHLSEDGQGERIEAWTTYFQRIANRLNRVVICNGEWHRVLTTSALADRHNIVGIYLDPPYREHGDEYATGSSGVNELWDHLTEWCANNGTNKKLRIVLSGYEGDFDMPDGWREVAYTATGTSTGNATRERFWLSPSCIGQSSLFDTTDDAA